MGTVPGPTGSRSRSRRRLQPASATNWQSCSSKTGRSSSRCLTGSPSQHKPHFTTKRPNTFFQRQSLLAPDVPKYTPWEKPKPQKPKETKHPEVQAVCVYTYMEVNIIFIILIITYYLLYINMFVFSFLPYTASSILYKYFFHFIFIT